MTFFCSPFDSPAQTPAVRLKAALRLRLLALSKDDASSGEATDLLSWFEPLDFRRDEEKVVVFFPHLFFRHWFEQRGKKRLEEAIRQLEGQEAVIRYETCPLTPEASLTLMDNSSSSSFPTDLPLPEEPAFTFSTFFVGAKNQFALNILREAAEGGVTYNPLFLKGPSGTGKTHLLRALASRLTENTDQYPAVRYLTASDFAALFHQPPTQRDQARLWLRSSSAICVDDVHLLSRHPLAQEELTFLIDAMTALNRPVVCAYSTPGSSASGEFSGEVTGELSPSLLARLSMGIVLELADPDLDVRLRYAQNRLAKQNLVTGREVPLLLARRCPDLRHLGGVILRMAAYRAHTGQLPDENDLDTMLRAAGNPRALTPEAVLALVAARCGLTPRDLRGRKRDPRIVQARQVAMFLCRELLGESYPSLGRIFGGKDHSTVMHAVKKIREIQVTNKDVHKLVTELTQECRTHLF